MSSLTTERATRIQQTLRAMEEDAAAADFQLALIEFAKLTKEYSDDSKASFKMRPVIMKAKECFDKKDYRGALDVMKKGLGEKVEDAVKTDATVATVETDAGLAATFASTLFAKLKKEYSDDSKMRPVITNAETFIEKEDYRGALRVMLQERTGSEAAVDAIQEKNNQVLESDDEVEQVKRLAYVKRLYNLFQQIIPPRDEYGRTPYPTDGGEYHWGYDSDAGKERWIAYGKPSSKTGGAVHFRNCTVAEMIAELWRKGKALGLGVLQDTHPTQEEILECIKRGKIDYLRGKPFKTDLKTFPFISPHGYDRDQGQGAMQAVADILSAS